MVLASAKLRLDLQALGDSDAVGHVVTIGLDPRRHSQFP
jgi:hypothetical protein